VSNRNRIDTPWGLSDTAETLAPGVILVTTPSHGGLLLPENAPIPAQVTAAFINGPRWAEEDCELAIALALLQAAGAVKEDAIRGYPATKILEAAREIALRFPRYAAALDHLPKTRGADADTEDDR